jgi:hypothetical protein
MDFTSAEQIMDVVSDALRSLGIDKPLGYKSCLSSFACGLVDHSLPFKMRLNSVFFRVGDFVSAVTLREFLLSEPGMFHKDDLEDVCLVLDLFRGSPVEQEVEGFIYIDEDTGLLRVSLYMVSVVVPDFSRSLASLAQLPGDDLPVWRGDSEPGIDSPFWWLERAGQIDSGGTERLSVAREVLDAVSDTSFLRYEVSDEDDVLEGDDDRTQRDKEVQDVCLVPLCAEGVWLQPTLTRNGNGYRLCILLDVKVNGSSIITDMESVSLVSQFLSNERSAVDVVKRRYPMSCNSLLVGGGSSISYYLLCDEVDRKLKEMRMSQVSLGDDDLWREVRRSAMTRGQGAMDEDLLDAYLLSASGDDETL